MTFLFDVNTTHCTGSAAILKLKTLLKSAGWTVPSSSDGTTYNAAGDQITLATSGAGGLSNSRAWFRIQAPDAVRELVIQKSTTGDQAWRIKYSATAKFVGGAPAATVTPSATDEKLLMGSGTDASPTFGTTFFPPNNEYRLHMAADNANGYGFWLACAKHSGGITANGAFVFDPLVAGSYPAEDVDPVMFYVVGVSPFLYATSTGPMGYLKKGLGGEGFVNIPWLGIRMGGGATSVVFPNLCGSNPHTKKDDVFPVVWGRGVSLAAPNGYKGISSIIKFNGTARSTPSLLSISTDRDRIVFGDFNLPWNGGPVIL